MHCKAFNLRKYIMVTLAIVLGLLTGGCNMIKPENYQQKEPTLILQNYFLGSVTGYGMVQNRSGEVTRRFVVDMKGYWEKDHFILNENFVFDDGEKQHRIWNFTGLTAHHFSGTAADVTGIAEGTQAGNAINMKYVLQVPVNGKHYDINMDDWLFSVDKKVLLNRANMKKFGFTVGSITASFYKND